MNVLVLFVFQLVCEDIVPIKIFSCGLGFIPCRCLCARQVGALRLE